MAFDRAHRHTLIRDLVVPAPGSERGQVTAVDVRGVHAHVSAYLLEINGAKALCAGHGGFHLGEPAAKAQVAHPAALEALGLETHEAVGDLALRCAQRPAGDGAQVEGENRVYIHGDIHVFFKSRHSPTQTDARYRYFLRCARVGVNGEMCRTASVGWRFIAQLSA